MPYLYTVSIVLAIASVRPYIHQTAEIICQQPNISEGVKISGTTIQAAYLHGRSLKLECILGYEYKDGDVITTCVAHNQWSNELLTCRRLYFC